MVGRWVREFWLVALMAAVALALRLYALDGQPLWTDELFSLQSSAGRGFQVERLPRGVLMPDAPRVTALPDPAQSAPDDGGGFSAIYWGQARDTHPPGYYLLLRLWRELFGDSAASVRGISVIAGVLVVAAMTRAGMLMRGCWGGVIAGAITALSVQQIAYSQEARGYMPAAACMAIAATLMLRIRRDGWTRSRAALLGSAAVASVWLLYMAAIPMLCLAVYAALELRGRDRLRTLATALVAALVLVATLGPLFARQQASVGERNKWLVADSRPLGETLQDAALALMTQIAPVQERSRPFAFLSALLLLLGAVPLYRRVPESRLWLMWIAAVFGTMLVWDLAASKIHLRQARYSLLGGIGLFGVAACLLPPPRGHRITPQPPASPAPPGPVGLPALPAAKHAPDNQPPKAPAPPSRPGALGLGLAVVPWGLVVLAGMSTPQAYDVPKEQWDVVTTFFQSGKARPGAPVGVIAFGGRQWDHILYLGLSHYAKPKGPAQPLPVAIFDHPDQSPTPLLDAARHAGSVTLFIEHGTDPTPFIPTGWTRTELLYFPTVGSLLTFAPPTPSPSTQISPP